MKISVAPEGCADKSSAAFKGSVLTFDEAVKSLDGKTASGDTPKLYMFEALEGSRVYDGEAAQKRAELTPFFFHHPP